MEEDNIGTNRNPQQHRIIPAPSALAASSSSTTTGGRHSSSSFSSDIGIGTIHNHKSSNSSNSQFCQVASASSPLPLPHSRRPQQRYSRGIGGGQVRLLGVHSEPGSFEEPEILEQPNQQQQQPKENKDNNEETTKKEGIGTTTAATTTTRIVEEQEKRASGTAGIDANNHQPSGSVNKGENIKKSSAAAAAAGHTAFPSPASSSVAFSSRSSTAIRAVGVGRHHHLLHQRQQSAMSSLYRQATVSAAAASVFNSTATTVANALEFVAANPADIAGGGEQQPNVPPPPIAVASRPQSANSAASFLSSTNTDSGSISCGMGGSRQAATRRANKAPTLQCTSSEEGSDSPLFSRTTSAQSLPAPPQSLSLYEHTLQLLANDPQYQKEIALGKRVGFYRLGKELGAGNFSKVKLGVHVLTKEKVAIKIMEKGKMDLKAQRLLAREIDNMELMHHPNIIRLFEVVSTLSKVYLVMEYAGGGELYTYVHENGKLTEEVAKPIFAQIVSAVAHLHSKNICHRDIKAENVFLSHPGWIKLGDFGFSCKFVQDSSLNTFCGSPPYAAPELFCDQHYVGSAVDVWAMGILLYFMLVGVTPFRGETVQNLKKNILEGVYYMPEYVSTFAQHSIARMLEIDAKRRANISELRRTYWLNECKFPDSYVNLSLKPDEGSLDRSVLERQVWSQLNSYGINEQMIRGAQGKGAKNAIIGTYRITLYQCQARDRDEERAKLNEHLKQLAERDQLIAANINARSKTCSIL